MITKKQFEEAYRKFSPSSCELFFIKYISVVSLSRNIWPVIISCFGLFFPFLMAASSHLLGLPMYCLYITSIFYAFLLALIAIYTFIIWYKKRKRIGNICKELQITKKQYEETVHRYYYFNYYPDIKDYLNNILLDKKYD